MTKEKKGTGMFKMHNMILFDHKTHIKKAAQKQAKHHQSLMI